MKRTNRRQSIIGSFLLLFGGLSSTAYAQNDIYNNPDYGPDSASRMECANLLSTMSEFMKIDLSDLALPSWRKVFNDCPASSRNIYLYGIKIYRDRLDREKDRSRSAGLLDTLMLIYDRRIEFFDQEGLVLGRKAIDLLRYDNSAIEKAYDILTRSVEISGRESEEPVMVTLMQSTIALFRAQRIEAQEVIDNYLLCTEILDQKVKSGESNRNTEIAINNIEALFAESGAATCADLVTIFQPKFEAQPENLELLQKITGLLVRRNCEDSDLFAATSEKLYEKEPSAGAAYNLAKLFIKRDEFDKVLDYYQKAIDSEEVPENKAKYCYEKAVILFNKYEQYEQARTYARQAISLKKDWGAPYILIGNAYAAGAKLCGGNDFEKSTVFWAAVDKFIEAKNVDESVTEEATDLINRYMNYFPNSEDTFFYGFQDGDPYTVGCWINEQTTVRTRK